MRHAPLGHALATALMLLVASSASASTFEIAHNPATNQYLVVYWNDATNDIGGQLFDASGAEVGGAITISNNDEDQTYPNVAVDPVTNRFLVVWQDARDTESAIYGQLVNGDGTLFDQDGDSTPEPDQDNIQIATDVGSANHAPAVVFDTVNQHFLVAFAGQGDTSVNGRRVGADGVAIAPAFAIATSLTSASAPAAAYDPERERTLVTWTADDGGAFTLFGRVVRADESLAGDSAITISDVDDPLEAKVAFHGENDRFLVVWADDTAAVRSQLVTPANTLDGMNQTLSSPVADQQRPDVVADGARARYLAVWDDTRNAGSNSTDVYGIFADEDGSAVDTVFAVVDTAATEHRSAVAANPTCANFAVVYADHLTSFSYDLAVFGPCVGVTVTPTSGLTTSEEETQVAFTVVLNSQPTADVTIDLASDDDTEGIVSIASVTFTTSNWDSPRNVTVTGVDDTESDGDQTYHIVTSAAVSDDPDYDGLLVDDVELQNLDDGEVPPGPPTLSWVHTDENGVDPDSGGKGTLFTFHVKYTSPADLAPVTHDLKIDFDGDGSFASAAGTASGPRSPGAAVVVAAALAALLLCVLLLTPPRRRRWAALAGAASLLLCSLAALHACGGDDCEGESGDTETYQLIESNPSDTVFSDGKDYEVTLAICKKGTLEYVFVFNDGAQNARGEPNTTQTLVVD